jgi:excinuclease ABC subunit C
VSDPTPPDVHPSLADRASRLPSEPGVYAFKDEAGGTLYVGKAGDLRARVRTYLAGKDTRPLISLVLRRAVDVEVVATRSASEALLLENTWIKRDRPPYNLRLKDDKSYLVLRVDRSHAFPRLRLVRRIADDGAVYFGPFASAKSLYRTLRYLRTLYPLRTCSDRELEERERPCLYHQIGRCSAPCVGKISAEDYGLLVEGALSVLRGRDEGVADRLRADMEGASDALEFERAARIRDRLHALEESVARQQAVSPDRVDRDVVAVASGDGTAVVGVVFVRDGVLVATRAYPQRTTLPKKDVVTAFLAQFHVGGKVIPPEILVEEEPHDVEGVEAMLSGLRGARVRVREPSRGAGRELVEVARRNAELALEEHATAAKGARSALEALASRLDLPGPPQRIEGYDVSHLAGTEPVAAMSVLTAGVADPSSYRHFAMREAPGGDDFAGMGEAVRRRFLRGAELGPLPDLVLIDGGSQQVAAAHAAVSGLGLVPPPIVGLAKARGTRLLATPERIVVPGRAEPIVLPSDDPALRLLVRARDEAHRFAGRYQRKRRGAAMTGTVLDDVPGIGPKRRADLLRRFGSVEGIRSAPFEDLAAVPGIGERLAREIRERVGA